MYRKIIRKLYLQFFPSPLGYRYVEITKFDKNSHGVHNNIRKINDFMDGFLLFIII